MQAMQMRIPDVQPVPMSLTDSGPVRSSTTVESFRFKWQQVVSLPEAYTSAQSPRATAVAEKTPEESVIPASELKISKGAQHEADPAIPDRAVVTSAPPNAAAGRDGRENVRTLPQATVTPSATLAAKSSRARYDAEGYEQSNTVGAAKSPAETATLQAPAPIDTSCMSASVVARHADFSTKPPSGRPPSSQYSPRTTRPGQPSTAEPSGKSESTKSDQQPHRIDAPGVSAKQSTAVPVMAGREDAETAIAAISMASGTHTVATGGLNVPSLAAEPSHLPLAPAQTDAQLQQGKFANAASSIFPQVVASGPAKLDVGVFDGTHGWLRIRAELDSGGAVNASLTVSVAAHDSLKAALPEMASYLGSEAVSVNRLAVHRFAESQSAGLSAVAEGQQSGQAPGHRSRSGDEAQEGADSAKSTPPTGHSEAETEPVIPQTVSAPGFASTTGSSDWIRGISRVTPLSSLPFGVLGTGGSWLSVCA
jgi:hypothetical protein